MHFAWQAEIQETHGSDMLEGPGADILRAVRSLEHQVTGAALRMTGPALFSWQAQYLRQMEWKNRRTHWYEDASSPLNFQFLKEVSQTGFVFDVVNFEN